MTGLVTFGLSFHSSKTCYVKS